MNLRDLIEPEDVHLGLEASGLVQALETVAELVAPGIGVEAKAIVDALLERERLGSTSVGDTFAIPHCKIANLDRIEVFLARFSTTVDFSSAADEEPVRFLFVVLSPPDQPATHLKVLSQIARLLKRREVRRRLLEATGSDEVVRALHDAAEEEGLL